MTHIEYVTVRYRLFKTMLRMISIVFLFLVGLRFLSKLSTIEVVRYHYINNTVKSVRQF